MSSDPHAPTPAGPDPDEATEVRAPADPFAPPVAEEPIGSAAVADTAERAADGTPEPSLDPPVDAGAGADDPQPTPTVTAADATPDRPAGTAAPEADWLKPEADSPATPGPEPLVSTPSSFTPPGTPEGEPGLAEKAQTLVAEKPEVLVGLAFLGGAVGSFLLKKLGRT